MPCRTEYAIGDKVRIVEVLDPGLNRQYVRTIGTVTEIRFDKRGVFFHIAVPVAEGAMINVVATKIGRIPKPLSKGVKPDAPKEAPPVSSESVPAPAGFGPGPGSVPHTSTATGNGIVAKPDAGAGAPKA